MKTQRRLVAAVLTLSVLLSMFGGGYTSVAAAQAATTVTTDSELAYDPLPQTASIVYEQHEDGYAVSLNRSADNVTMNITAVPADESSRAAEKARLYVHSGVELKPNTAYRVSYSLLAENAQPEYEVCFDSGSAEGAYGALTGRSIEAGSTDQVKYEFTSGAESSELVLRLLLGKTGQAGNTLRFSNLAVEEVPGNEIGENKILTDSLDYNAPGFIRLVTNADSGAVITSDGKSATLTVTKEPTQGAEVWKIKMLLATGFKPAAGRAYHFTADVVSTEARGFELCYNEGDTEKGFGAEYSQRLTGKSQELDYIIHIPGDKKDPGELIIQFSLGMLKTGEKFTISNINLEDAQAGYDHDLSDSFSFQKATSLWVESPSVSGTAEDVTKSIDWTSTARVWATGDNIREQPTVKDGSATLRLKPALTDEDGEFLENKNEAWEGRLNIDTGATLKAGASYLVSFNIESSKSYGFYEVLYGTGLKNATDNNDSYNKHKQLALNERSDEDEPYRDTLETTIEPEEDGGLLISLWLGKTDGKFITVTASDLRIVEVKTGEPVGSSIAKVNYPSEDEGGGSGSDTGTSSFRVRDGKGELSGDGESVTITLPAQEAKPEAFQRGLFIDDICTLAAGTDYQVSFEIKATQKITYEVSYNKDGDWGDSEGAYGKEESLTATTEWSTHKYTIEATEKGTLRLRIDLGLAPEGTQVTVRNIRAEKVPAGRSSVNTMSSAAGGRSYTKFANAAPAAEASGTTVDLSGLIYPSGSLGSFEARDKLGQISGNGTSSATITWPSKDINPVDRWRRALFIDDICDLEAGASYKVSFGITGDSADYKVSFFTTEKYGDGFDSATVLVTSSSKLEKTITPAEGGKLTLRIDPADMPDGTALTVSNIQVEKIGGGSGETGDGNLASVSYPNTDVPANAYAPFRARDDAGTITGDGSSVTMTLPEQRKNDAGNPEGWMRGLFVDDICTLIEGADYKVSFEIQTSNETAYEACYNKDQDWNDNDNNIQYEGVYGKETGKTATSVWSTCEHTISNSAAGKLRLRIDLGLAPDNTVVTVKNIKVERTDGNQEGTGSEESGGVNLTLDYPDINLGSFEARDRLGDITGGTNSATMTWPSKDINPGDLWRRALFINDICRLEAGTSYKVSFGITGNSANYKVSFFTTGNKYDSGFASETVSVTNSSKLEKTITPAEGGNLTLRIDPVSMPDGTSVTVSNIQVTPAGDDSGEPGEGETPGGDNPDDPNNPGGGPSGGEETEGKDIAKVNYPTSSDRGSFEARDGEGTITGDGSSATITLPAQEAEPAAWQRGLFTGKIADLKAGTKYEVSFEIKATKETKYDVCYNKDGDWGDGHEKGFGDKYGLTASSEWSTCTYTIEGKGAGALSLRIDLGLAPEGTQVTVRNIKVMESGGETPDDDDKTPLETDVADVTYPQKGAQPSERAGSFRVEATGGKDGKEYGGKISAGEAVESIVMTCTGGEAPEASMRSLFIEDIGALAAGVKYEVSFRIKAESGSSGNARRYALSSEGTRYEVFYNGDWGLGYEKGFDGQLVATSEFDTYKYIIDGSDRGKGELSLRIDLGYAGDGTEVTIEKIRVVKKENPNPDENGLNFKVTYPSGSSAPAANSFEARDRMGTITGSGQTATMTWPDKNAEPNALYNRGLFINNICGVDTGASYEVSLDIKGDPADYIVYFITVDDKWSLSHPNESVSVTNESWSPVTGKITVAGGNGKLTLRIDPVSMPDETSVTVRNIQVRKIESSTSEKTVGRLSSVWAEAVNDSEHQYEAELTKNSGSAELKVTKLDKMDSITWGAKLCIPTGVRYSSDKAYRAKFDIKATNAQENFCVLFQGVPDSVDLRGTWDLSIKAGETKTITTRTIPADMFTSKEGELILQLELGKLDKGESENTFTVSNVSVEEISYSSSGRKEYLNELTCDKNIAILKVTKTNLTAEDWKVKMFIDTGVRAEKGETFRVAFDIWAEEKMEFGVCYNRDDEEKDYGSLTDLSVPERETKTVEYFFTASKTGYLNLQLMLGLVMAPNEVRVRNLRVDYVDYSYSGKSVLPNGADYKAPSAVSYWAHEDYTTEFTGADNAITANIKAAPTKGAEPWKIKLFLDTGTPLQAGKYYKVTANVKARLPQDYEICYNNGGVEMGYDSLGGLRLAGGETQTVEKIISVPAGKTGTDNLTLQFNLGKTTAANEITVSGVKVEETSLSYIDMMSKDFAYTANGAVNLWTNPDYTANLEGGDGKATLHITGVPSTGAEVWKVKMLVKTGAILSAGKTYLVRANLTAAKGQNYEVCFNNEETEKGFDALYNQTLAAGGTTTVVHNISVPASMTDAGELVLQFSVGGAVTNDITVSNVSVQELNFGTGDGNFASDTVINLYNAPQTAAGTLDITREKLTYRMTKISSEAKDNAITISGADLRADDLYTVVFTARSDKNLTGTFALNQAKGAAVISEQFRLTPTETTYSFTTKNRLTEGGAYDLLWQFGSADNQAAGGADVEISKISVYSPPEKLQIIRGKQNVTVNGVTVKPDTYNINGNNYVKLRDLALLLNGTDAQFVVRYNSKTKLISLTTGKEYTPVGGELAVGEDKSASCVRSYAKVAVNGKAVNLKAYNIGLNNFFKLRDLDELLGYKVEYVAEGNAAAITSPLTPEAQEKAHAYDLFFLPEIDGESQPYVGDTMPYYENGVYYIYYLKEGGDSYNHSVYLTTTKDFVTYTELDNPVLSASREDVQDNWIGTGSVVKVDDMYYFFYTGYNASGSQEYHEKIMVAKGSSPTSFEKVSGWEIVPPSSLGQKNDFRDPQAYYDPSSKTISLTVTAAQDGVARILKYTLGKDLQGVKYDGIIFTDPTGDFWNLECSDTFRIGNKWYLTYSGQEDTLWYAMADSRFGPYSDPVRLDGKLFYAAKHVEDGKNTYMVGWARRANSASSTEEVAGWAGNIAVQKLSQRADGSLTLVPVDSIVSSFDTQKDIALGATQTALTAGSDYSYKEAFTSYESFMLSGEFTYSGAGSFGLAFDFNGKEEQYKLISIDPAANKLSLSFNEGTTLITETKAALSANQTHSFTYIQDGSVGIFYLDNQAALLVRLYGVTDKPIYLFAENNSVTFTSLRQYTQ